MAGETTVAVAAVIDGDTFRLADGSTIRLAGIEAPEKPLSQAADAPWPLGEAARAGLGALVVGATVGITWAGEGADRYGNRHAYVFLADGRAISALLLGEGLARARRLPGEEGCFPSFLAAEKPARLARLGLWASPEYAVKSADDPSLPARNGLYDLVEGRVVSVGHGSRMIFLDFGRSYRRDFTVMVPPAVADALTAAGMPADGFAGRRVVARGLIEEAAGGPAMRLNDPAEIEIMDDDVRDDVGDPR